MRTKAEELQYINSLQEQYVDQLIEIIDSKDNSVFKETNLTAPTGSGKTEMIAKLINKKIDWFFLVTTLSHGQLNEQIKSKLKSRCVSNNYVVYGVSSFTKTSSLQAEAILAALPKAKKVIWIRDEGHRNTNNWSALLEEHVDKIVNVSATNKMDNGVVCNFADTMMLRTVMQQSGDFDQAIERFLEVKAAHVNVPRYTPCILFRIMRHETEIKIIEACKSRGVRYKSLIGFNNYNMSDLCKDDCDVEAIIYQQKMDVGVDIRRAHVIWIETEPKNIATTIQCIGRCRRNALFWRDDVDIMLPENSSLMQATQICHAFYKVHGMHVDTNEFGELVNVFCPYISVQQLRPGSNIEVNNGVLPNGLNIIELAGCTGEFAISKDKNTGFNIVNNKTFYKSKKDKIKNHLLDSRMELFFAPSKDMHKAVANIVNEIEADSRACAKFGFGVVGFTGTCYETCRVGFYKEEKTPVYRLGYWNGKWEVNTSWKRKYVYQSKSEFLEDLDNYVLTQKNRNKLNLILDFAKTVGRWKNKYPIDVSHERYKKRETSFFSGDNVCVELKHKSNVMSLRDFSLEIRACVAYRFHDYSYNFEECQRIAHCKTIAPDLPQHYEIITNNKELAIIGPELYQCLEGKVWRPIVSVTRLLDSNTKFKKFIYSCFVDVLNKASPYYYKQKNEFGFDKKQNTCLGSCVEYYAKSLLYKNYIQNELDSVDRLLPKDDLAVIFRACLEKYRNMMIATFGQGMSKTLRLPSIETLGKNEYKTFVKTCMSLGTQTKIRIQELLGFTDMVDMKYDPVLSTRHLCGLMDVVSYDTIIDIKVTSEISEKMLLQVLAYYYLSTLRSDLAIDKVIVYDAACDRYLAISGLRSGKIEASANYQPPRRSSFLDKDYDRKTRVPPRPASLLNETPLASQTGQACAAITKDRKRVSYEGKQWICPGVTRKKYLELCMSSLVLGKWVVESMGGLPFIEHADELAKGYRLPRQFQSKEDAVEFARECLREHFADSEISVHDKGDIVWIKGFKPNPNCEYACDELECKIYPISDETKDRIAKYFQGALGLTD